LPSTYTFRMDLCKRHHLRIHIPKNGRWRPPICTRFADGKYYLFNFYYYILIYSSQTSEQCLEIFRHNLLDIGIHPSPYGTHSFRRGGCQWLASYRRWKLRRICDWGGWSTEFSSLTIVKYLISWNDDPTETRDNFFNPNQAPSLLCFHCGRSCSCA
jgi:hypothetical protein